MYRPNKFLQVLSDLLQSFTEALLTIKTLRATRVNRVTRKVNFTDRSAGYQCHSIFLSLTNLQTYLVGLTTVTLPPKFRSLLWNAA
jgi:hypothetical protein